MARKAVGNFVEMAALATLHLSPMMLLAIVSDVAYGSKTYLKELAGDLKRRKVIAEDSTIDSLDDLLGAVASASATASGVIDTPPLSVDGLKQTIDQTRTAVARLDPTKVVPQAELKRLWDDIHELAASQGVSPLAVSGAMTLYALGKIASVGSGALSTVTSAGVLLDRHVIEHYRAGLKNIWQKGIYAALRETSKPYIEAVWKNFSSQKETITEGLASGRLLAEAWRVAHRWLGPRIPEGEAMEEEKGTGPISAKHPAGRSGKSDLSPLRIASGSCWISRGCTARAASPGSRRPSPACPGCSRPGSIWSPIRPGSSWIPIEPRRKTWRRQSVPRATPPRFSTQRKNSARATFSGRRGRRPDGSAGSSRARCSWFLCCGLRTSPTGPTSCGSPGSSPSPRRSSSTWAGRTWRGRGAGCVTPWRIWTR